MKKAKKAINRIICSAGIISLAFTGISAAVVMAGEENADYEVQVEYPEDVVYEEAPAEEVPVEEAYADDAYVQEAYEGEYYEEAAPSANPSIVAVVTKDGVQSPGLSITGISGLTDSIYYYDFTVGNTYEIRARIVDSNNSGNYIEAGSVWIVPEAKDGWTEIYLDASGLKDLGSGNYYVELTVTEGTYSEWIDYGYIQESYQSFAFTPSEDGEEETTEAAKIPEGAEYDFYRVAGGPSGSASGLATAGVISESGMAGVVGRAEEGQTGQTMALIGTMIPSSAPSAADLAPSTYSSTTSENKETTTSKDSKDSATPKSSKTNTTSSAASDKKQSASDTTSSSSKTSTTSTTSKSSSDDQVNKTKYPAATDPAADNGNPPQTDDPHDVLPLVMMVLVLAAVASTGFTLLFRRRGRQ